MTISKLMYEYLKSYMRWIEEGAVDMKPYFRKMGLCGNTAHFGDNLCKKDLNKEIKTLFNEEGFDPTFPFGWTNYTTREQKATQHEDPLRLQWIKDHIEGYEQVKLFMTV